MSNVELKCPHLHLVSARRAKEVDYWVKTRLYHNKLSLESLQKKLFKYANDN